MRLGQRTTRRTVMDSFVPYLAISSAALFIPLNGKYDGPSLAQRSIEGLRFKTHQLLESGYWILFSELHDEPAGRTVIATTDRHKLRNPTLGQTSPSSFSSFSTLPPTDRHKHDGPSSAPQVVSSAFLHSKSPHSTLFRFPAKQRETHIKTSTKRLSDTLNLRKKY